MRDANPADRPHDAGAALPDGGDAACWLSEVCPDCGAINDAPTGPCWRCGTERGDDGPLPHPPPVR